MAILPIRAGQSNGQIIARGRATTVPPLLANVPGGLYPFYSAAFELDEYRMKAGWPVPVPDGDIEIPCLVSAEGTVLANREAPSSLITNANMRWIADTNYYDQTTLRWTPIQGGSSPWETSPEHAPTLVTDYNYRVGDERFNDMTALNFDSNTNDYMWINLNLYMGGIQGYTVIMALCPSSIYGNDVTTPANALWGPDTTTITVVVNTTRQAFLTGVVLDSGNYVIDWGDGNVDSDTTLTQRVHSYTANGNYTIQIVGPNGYLVTIGGVQVTSGAASGPYTTNTSGAGWVLVTVKGRQMFLTTDATAEQPGVAIGEALASSAPSYIALVISRPQTTMYALTGPNRMLSKSLTTGPVPVPLNTRFWLGNSPFTGSASMDMALLDLGIYGTLLTKNQVTTEFALLSQVYGV